MKIITPASTIRIKRKSKYSDDTAEPIKIKNFNEYKVLINTSGAFLFSQKTYPQMIILKINEGISKNSLVLNGLVYGYHNLNKSKVFKKISILHSKAAVLMI